MTATTGYGSARRPSSPFSGRRPPRTLLRSSEEVGEPFKETTCDRPAPTAERSREHKIVVDWIPEDASPDPKSRVAYELASVLVEAPAAPVARQQALRARGGLGAADGVRGATGLRDACPFELVGDFIPELPPIRRQHERAEADRLSEIGGARATRPARSSRMSGSAKHGHVAGEGGRKRRVTPFSQTTATADLYKLLGAPEERSFGSARMLIFVYDPLGDGCIVARLSDRDIQNGETAMAQVHGGLEQAKRQGRSPRLIVVTTNLSGANLFRRRPDLQLIQDEIEKGTCRWVYFRGVDRLARKGLVFYEFIELIVGTGTDLLLEEIPGRAVDWERDDIHLGFNSLMSERERQLIYKRTHGPLMTRWLGEGRGWPGGLPFGFKRNAVTKYAEICPVQWRAVRTILFTYAQHEDGKGGGIRAIEHELKKQGFAISRETIRRILGRTVYYDGRWTTTRAGQTVENRPIEIPEHLRIPPEIQARVQRLRKVRKGKDTVTPPGLFALNPLIEFVDGTRLRAKVERDGYPAAEYWYRPYVVKSGVPQRWRGTKISLSQLHRAVAVELRRLASCEELQREYAEIARPGLVGNGPTLDEAARIDLEAKIANLERTREALKRQYLADLAKGGPETKVDVLGGFNELTSGIDDEINRHREQLERAKALDGLRKSTRPDDNTTLLEALEQVLPLEPPSEAELIEKFAAFVGIALSKIVIDIGDEGEVIMQLHGPLVPSDLPLLRVHDPMSILQDELRAGADGVVGALFQPTLKRALECRLEQERETPELPAIGSRNPETVPKRRALEGGVPAWSSPSLRLDAVSAEKTFMSYEWDTVLRVCELRRQGLSQARIGELFEQEEVPTPRGGRWTTPGAVANLLTRLRRQAQLPPDVRKALEIARVPRTSGAEPFSEPRGGGASD